ncbi:MAG: thiopurine S-methyltransferase [Methylococcaceae bacterium]|jgi:thiopurine S-methyltransferase
MDANFWLRRWENNEIGFHEREANPLLLKYFDKLCLTEGKRVFIPLCGKTLDIAWFLSKGYRVAGAELSKLAVGQLFEGLGLEPTITTLGELEHYSAQNIDIFVGDLFKLSSELLGPVDAIYDRAALVALPEPTRILYTAHLMAISAKAPQLLICYEYDNSQMDGPPFSITSAEVKQHYSASYTLTLLESLDVPDGFKRKFPATESVWLLA